ncbi:SurA N-terminal domain-containing protein [Kaistia nematophila]|uniref:SurA N-terminal domain-containing protein n=1 Tax=Kaistia nematophila TaxID=2994654 RepID=A0A9X3IMG8_9HYPH|nr:SurA N-terminal domain-containing protein [Kaistia nematophila]MBN9059351.1 SurA N-terminal domain-containing protein [Hyphomicrobiales bacterium]MCX5570531.1 SurA N-terminal domain-containing protein [Kaistia nematophila]
MRNRLNSTLLPAIAIALGLASASLPATAFAQAAVRATVNDQAITSYDVSQRIKLMKLFHQPSGDKAVLDDMIDETLLDQVAKRRGMSVPDSAVEERFNGIAKQVKLPPAQFAKALSSQGVQADTLRKFLRAQMMSGMVIKARARSIKVSEADVQAQIEKQGINTENATIKEFKLQQIVFVVPKGSSPGFVGQRQREAEAFRKRFAGCDGSLAQAKAMKGVVVLNMGRRDSAQVQGPVGDELKTTPVGGTLKPQVTERGVEIIAICEAKEVRSSAGVRAEIEEKLTAEQGKNLGKDFIAELRKDAKINYK